MGVNYDYYEKAYYHEIRRTDEFDSRVGTAVTVLAGLGGAVMLVWAEASSILMTLTLLCTSLWLASLVMVLRAFWFHTWLYLPVPTAVLAWEPQLAAYCEENGISSSQVGDLFREQMAPLLAKAAEQHFSQNHNRHLWLRWAYVWLAATAVSCGLTLISLM